jgi:hypothetical protein
VIQIKVVFAESQQGFATSMNAELANLKGKRVLSVFYTTDAIVRVNKTTSTTGSSIQYDSTIIRYYNGFIEYEEQ